MQLRTFFAQDMRDAFAQVRDEMGPEAVILSTEDSADGGVMVRAALDQDDMTAEADMAFDDQAEIFQTIRQAVAAGRPMVRPRRHPVLSRSGKAVPAPRKTDAELPVPSMDTGAQPGHQPAGAPVQKQKTAGAQVRTLRQRPSRRRFDRGEMLTIFAQHRLPDTLAHQLAEKCAGTGIGDMTLALAAAIDARMLSNPVDFSSAKAILLLGLGGAGKTATAAKLAAHAQLAGRHVTLIAGDTEGAGAVARLQAFAEHLGTGIEPAATPTKIAECVRNAMSAGRLAIVDTAGFDPRQKGAANALMPLAKSPFVETVGIVSAMTDSEEMQDVAAGIRAMGASRLIVTQLDLVRRLGAVTAAALADGIAIAHTTRSPFVAGGLETPTPHSLARLLVENEEESVQ